MPAIFGFYRTTKRYIFTGMLEDITLKEFNSLNKSEQAEALWEYGELISNRFENDYTIMLYQISSFYVEVNIMARPIPYLKNYADIIPYSVISLPWINAFVRMLFLICLKLGIFNTGSENQQILLFK